MSVFLKFLCDCIKKTAICALIFGLTLQNCTYYESARNMTELEGATEFNIDKPSAKNDPWSGKATAKKDNNCCKSTIFFLGGLLIGGLTGIIGLPIMKNEWNSSVNQYEQCSASLATAKFQTALLSQPLAATLANNPTGLYGLANGDFISGNSTSIGSLSPSDILGIESISLVETDRLYTAEEEFAFIDLSELFLALTNLQNITLGGQYFSTPVELSDTALVDADFSNSYINSAVILPTSISSIDLTDTTLCPDGSIVCTDGNSTAPNCDAESVNSQLIDFNQMYSLGSLCSNYTAYQQILTNAATLNATVIAMNTVLGAGGAQACVDAILNYKTCSGGGKYPNATALYNLCSYNGNYPNATAMLKEAQNNYKICNANYTSLTTKYNLSVDALAKCQSSLTADAAAVAKCQSNLTDCQNSLSADAQAYSDLNTRFTGICNAGVFCQAGDGCGQNRQNAAVGSCTYAGSAGSDVGCGRPTLKTQFNCP